MYDRDDSAPSLLSFLIGGIVGATLTCLLAPQSGIALRRRIGARVGAGARKARAALRPANVPSEAVPEPGLPAGMGGDDRG
jgi:hypothetical protein